MKNKKIADYNHLKIEPKWQKVWEKKDSNKAKDNSKQKKFYGLIEFPYPSGAGLHVGHIRSNTAMDIICRKRRREGYNVLYPIGWDAFGLPTENYAIKTGIQPSVVTKTNTDTFRRQLKSLGFSFDWSREVDTTNPKYYKWTQWIFLQLLKNDLAYKKKMSINWCPKDLIGLANEEVVNGCCERCGTKVEKREKEQWMLAITKYADRLDKDLDDVDFLEKIKIQQRNWIGRSEGTELDFKIVNSESKIRVFTTRADTLFGVTYVVLAPENKLVQSLKSQIKNWSEVEKYIVASKNKSDIERTDAKLEKTGVELKGISVINPTNNEKVPVWISDYVLVDYGTGAVMAVPAHDERDYAFAKKYNLPIKEVIIPIRVDKKNPPQDGKKVVERKTIHALVRNKDGKVLCVKWKKFPWTGFIVGGVDEGEDIVEAARREVLEETGYKNLKLVRVLGGTVRGEYFAAHKDENRIAYSNAVLFDLINDEREEVGTEEKEKHDAVWLDPKSITPDNFTCAELDLWFGRINKNNDSYTDDGVLINSGKFNGISSEQARIELTKNFGQAKVSYKLKDWVFSRQRYWGEPIPVIHCEKCGIVPVPEKDLPVELPKVKNYQPTQTGESPLAGIDKWVNTKCPKCKGKAKRETDTMPQWAGSSWYYLRYVDPKNSKSLADPKKLKYWTPVDWYNGGMEHTTLHLLYSRFWHKFLYDIKVVPTKEPYKKRTSHGMILAEGGEKMSKSKGNVINPDDIVKNLGADTIRIYEMFMGPFDQAIVWDMNNIAGSRRFIEKVWKLQEKIGANNADLEVLVHKTIKKISEDIEGMKFNTAISSLMILLNEFEKEPVISKNNYGLFLQLLAPFAPHMTEEIWANLGNKKSIHLEKWPKYDEKKIVSEKIKILVQINGKPRSSFEIPVGSTQTEVEKVAFAREDVSKWLIGKQIKNKMFIKEKILSIITD
ncbi:MAG: class I tRNA ligase family protein [bacterium]